MLVQANLEDFMGMPARTITRDFIAKVNAIDRRNYIESYASTKLAIIPCRPYTASTILDEHLDIWATPRHAVIERLETDGNIVNDNLPLLLPLARLQLPYVEELPYFITNSVYEYAPLVRGGMIQTAAALYLCDDWAGLGRGTLFFHRETNFSTIYLALPDIRWNLETGSLFPSRLFPPSETGAHVAVVVETHAHDAAVAAAALVDTEWALAITNGTLEVIGTLSWATPAGPFVSAGIFIIESILGATLGQGQSLAANPQRLGQQIVDAVKDALNVRDLKPRSRR
jgi:hypothetical protein